MANALPNAIESLRMSTRHKAAMRVYSCKHFITGGVLILFSLLGTLSAQAGLNKVSVAQLEKLINANVGKSDSSLADKLYDVDLTERLSDARLKSASNTYSSFQYST